MTRKPHTITDLCRVEVDDVCGLWEVIRIYKDEDQTVSYPWVKDRFKFNFLPEMLFLCLKDGRTIHGTWELVAETDDSHVQHSIILNESYEFIILDICEDEMTLHDRSKNYLLVRRL